jgi:hypothetical protein
MSDTVCLHAGGAQPSQDAASEQAILPGTSSCKAASQVLEDEGRSIRPGRWPERVSYSLPSTESATLLPCAGGCEAGALSPLSPLVPQEPECLTSLRAEQLGAGESPQTHGGEVAYTQAQQVVVQLL